MPSPAPELIAVYGFLDRAGNFTLRRCYSTQAVRRWPSGNDAYALELLDEAGQILARSHPQVMPEEHCEAEAFKRWRVAGYVGLRTAAASLRLTAEGLVLWEAKVPNAPTLNVRLRGQRNAREKPVELRLKYSPGSPDSYVQIVYQWGEKQFQVLGYYAPAEVLKVDLRALPGGKRCRLVMHYSNGMRSTGAPTSFFAVPILGPQLSIVSPSNGKTLLPGQPLELVGAVLDRERPGGARPDDITWWLDDEMIGRGPTAYVPQPRHGRRRVRLRYEPNGAEVTTTVVVRPLENAMPLPAALWDQ